MNRSAFLYPLIGALIFIIGFFIVGATHKKLAEPNIAIMVDSELRALDNDTLVISETQTASFRLEHGAKTLETSWFIDNHPQPVDSILSRRFDAPGFYEVLVKNQSFLEKTVPVVVQKAANANVGFTADTGEDVIVGSSTFFTDTTRGVEKRQWFVNGKLIDNEDSVFECVFSKPQTYSIRLRNVLQDQSIALWEEEIHVQPKPQPVRRPSGGGGAPAKSSKAFSTRKILGFSSNDLMRKTNLDVEGPAGFKIEVLKAFEFYSVKLIGTSDTGTIKFILSDEYGTPLKVKSIGCSREQKTIPLNTEGLQKGRIYTIKVELEDGATIGAVPREANFEYNDHTDYFKILPSMENHWLFDWTIYVQ